MTTIKKVLMVVTNRDHYDAEHKTGLWLEEYAAPYHELRAAGYEVVVASPRGGQAPLDPVSVPEDIPAAWTEAVSALTQTVTLSAVNPADFAGVILPGGHGPLFDLAQDEQLAMLLRYFDEQQRLIAAVCHGLAGLLKAVTAAGQPLVAGRKVTGFTNQEEELAGLTALVPFAVETCLREQGGVFSAGAPWSEHVVIDGHWITGQNPQSSQRFATAVIDWLRAAH